LSHLSPEQEKAQKKAKETLWRKASIASWKLDVNQKEMYKFAREKPDKIIVIGSSRQLGKTYFLVTLALEECLRTPHAIVKFIAPKVRDIKRIIAPLIREITDDCPKDLRPSYKTQENIFRFPNGSEIQLAGTDNGHAESIRGNKANLCIIDEAGFCNDLAYIVNSILIPTTTTTGGKIIMASTPSKSPDHDFMQFMKQAEIENRFIKKTIFDNPRLTKKDIDDLAEAIGGYESVDFKREYLVEIITSIDDAVVPEFNSDVKPEIIKEWERPAFYDAYVGMDIGVKDMTVVLFGYYDFLTAKLIIEDEVVLSGRSMLTDNLAAKIAETEARLWFNKYTGEPKTPFLRVSDNNNLVLLNDLAGSHGLTFLPTRKDDKDAALNNMRMLIRNKRIIIHPRCKTLIFHLESAIWNNDRTKYVRSAVDKSHYDAVDALVYLCRNINYNKNPYPANYDYLGKGPMFHRDPLPKGDNQFEQALNKMVKERNPFGSTRKLKRY